jgi:hypothetical protein
MGMWGKLALCAGAAAIAGAAFAQPAGQKVTGPIATYWMSAATQSGFGMPGMGGGGGGRPSASQIMAMMQGGGAAQHTLTLQLGSSQKAPGPQAEHLPPEGLAAGASLPLLTPQSPPPAEDDTPRIPREYQKPKGRMLIFWGCGDHARPGQPVVIDFAQMQAGKMPAGMEALTRGLGVRSMQPPSPSRNATYGEWPNERTRVNVPSEGSLVGDHVVRGNYSPEIKFTLTPPLDFLGALNLTTNAKTPMGSAQLGWGAVRGAQAYLASAVGGSNGGDTIVMWTSSEAQTAAFAMPDYIAPADLERLVASHALMSPQTTTCTVPKEVVDAAPQALVQLVAYGREANFVYPPRPADPKVAWNQQWQVKVRYRSATGGMLGMEMPNMAGGDEDGPPRRGGQRGAQQQPPPQSPADAKAERRRAIMKGLGGALGLPN